MKDKTKNAKNQSRFRERNRSSGKKELREYVPIELHDEIKQMVRDYVKMAQESTQEV